MATNSFSLPDVIIIDSLCSSVEQKDTDIDMDLAQELLSDLVPARSKPTTATLMRNVRNLRRANTVSSETRAWAV